MRELKTLIEVSHQVGKKIPLWVQGAGGNISVKKGDALYIKATGKRLDSIAGKQDIAKVDFRAVARQLPKVRSEMAYKDLLHGAADTTEYGKPSMETGFHAALPRKWVIHFHPVSMVLLGQNFTRLEKFFKATLKKLGWSYAVYPKTLPGLKLSKAVQKNSRKNFYLLKNHGIILQFEEARDLKKFEQLENELTQYAGWDFSPGPESGPLQAYFPDTAVFWKEFEKYLKKDGRNFQLKPDAPLHLQEIWQASMLLFRNCPKLSSFTLKEISTITNLPLEQLRK